MAYYDDLTPVKTVENEIDEDKTYFPSKDPDSVQDNHVNNESSNPNESLGAAPNRHRWDLSRHISVPALFGLTNKNVHEMAARHARNVQSNFRDNLPLSLMSDYDSRESVAKFAPYEVALGKLLGTGAFSNVFEVKSFELDAELGPTLSMEECEERLEIKTNEKFRGTNKARYAMKSLRRNVFDLYGEDEYVQIACDLAREAEFLSSLQHPNIIKLRGISQLGPAGFEEGPREYFLIIDKLDQTLRQRIGKWKKLTRRRRLSLTYFVKKKKEQGDKKDLLLDEQLHIALQIAGALVYLHDRNVIYRDLKPDNVGFDVRGDVKIFDFGLACVTPTDGDPNEEAFCMSGAGSLRYMAKEVIEEECYNAKADVYTFALCLWEILSLQMPYPFIRSKEELVQLMNDGIYPNIDESWPSTIKEMLNMSFDTKFEMRPVMSAFFITIRVELMNLRGGDSTGLQDSFLNQRRTALSKCGQHDDSELKAKGSLKKLSSKFRSLSASW